MEHLESLAFKKLSSYVLFHDINYLFLRAQGEGLALLLTMGCILGYNEWWFSFNLEPHCFICSDFPPHMDTWQVQVKKGQHLHDIYIELTNIIYRWAMTSLKKNTVTFVDSLSLNQWGHCRQKGQVKHNT